MKPKNQRKKHTKAWNMRHSSPNNERPNKTDRFLNRSYCEKDRFEKNLANGDAIARRKKPVTSSAQQIEFESYEKASARMGVQLMMVYPKGRTWRICEKRLIFSPKRVSGVMGYTPIGTA